MPFGYVAGGAIVGGLLTADAPEADPAVGQAARENAEIAGRYADLAEEQYADQRELFNEYRPMLTQQLEGSLLDQQQSRERADDAWASYTSTWRPIEQDLAQRTQDLSSASRVEQEGQRAASEATTQYDRARTENQRTLAAAGVSPAKMAALERSGRLIEAKGVAGAASGARQAQESRALGYLDNAARFGRNQTSTGLAAAGLATTQGAAVQSGYSSLVSATAAPAAGAASLYSGAVNANSSSANAALGLFGAESATYQNQMAMIGDLAGAGAMAYGMKK